MWFSARYPITPQRYDKRTWQSYDSIRFSTIRYDSVWFSVQSLRLAFPHGMPRWATMNLSCATFCHQIAHHAAHFLPAAVGMHKFCATCLHSQDRKKFCDERLVHAFWRLREQKRQIFRAFAQIWHGWRGWFTDVVLHFCLVCLVRWCDVNCWLSAFERELEPGERSNHYSITVITV